MKRSMPLDDFQRTLDDANDEARSAPIELAWWIIPGALFGSIAWYWIITSAFAAITFSP